MYILIPKYSKKQSKSPKISAPRRSPQKTIQGSSALNAISRFSNDVVSNVANRYTSRGGLSKLASDVTKLMAMVNTEDKHLDITNVAAACNATTPLIQVLPTIAQGNLSSQRSGDSVLINKIDVEMLFQFSGTAATATSSDQNFRWWILRYKKTPTTSGTTPFNISEFLNVDGSGNYTPLSLMDTDTNENFQIMCTGDVQITLPTLASTQLVRDKTFPLRHTCHFHQAYNGSGSANICDNMCFFVCVATNAANTAGFSQVTTSHRLWFIDN